MRRFLATFLVAAAWPSAAQAASFEPLERGDRGPHVRVVQRALTKVGLRTTADGVFGRRTARSVRRYERRIRIRVDGRVSRGQARGLLRRAHMRLALIDRAVLRATAAQAPVAGGFPIQGRWTTGDGFGTRGGRHQGVDLMAACGTPLVAAEAGRVVFIGSHARAGNYLVVRTPGGDHVYMHLERPADVRRGESVAAGRRLGTVGRTGNATACHLHFEIWTPPGWYEGGRPRDPRADLQRWAAS